MGGEIGGPGGVLEEPEGETGGHKGVLEGLEGED